jgi:hypothetical protein
MTEGNSIAVGEARLSNPAATVLYSVRGMLHFRPRNLSVWRLERQ